MRVRVLICPDKFAGTLTAIEAAAAMAEGWLAAAPDDEVVVRPLADGGPGFLNVLATAVGGHLVAVPSYDPLGRPVTGSVLIAGETAYLESAQVCGLNLLHPEERDPRRTTSYGLGPLVLAAVESGVREVVVGLGGSATNDGGAGLLAALGAAPVDEYGYVLAYGGAPLIDCAGLSGQPAIRDVQLVAATDVDSPLTGAHGASLIYGRQKGGTAEDVLLLDLALEKWAAVLQRDLKGCPRTLARLPGGGAAGGIGAAILALGGRRESGIALVRRLTGWDESLATADLVITGEGSFDDQSLRGKVVAGVASAARERGVPCLVLAGRVDASERGSTAAGVTGSYSLVEHLGSPAEALSRSATGLRELAAKVARQWRQPDPADQPAAES